MDRPDEAKIEQILLNYKDSELFLVEARDPILALLEEAEKRGIDTALTAYESTCAALIQEAHNRGYTSGEKEGRRRQVETDKHKLVVCPKCDYAFKPPQEVNL